MGPRSEPPARDGSTVDIGISLIASATSAVLVGSGTQFCPRVIGALEQLYADEPHLLGGPAELRAISAA
jgi:hypothetical protein